MTREDGPAERAVSCQAAPTAVNAARETQTEPYVTVGHLLTLLRLAVEKGGCEDAPLEVAGCRFGDMHLRVTYNIGIEENMTVTLEGEPLRDETKSRP